MNSLIKNLFISFFFTGSLSQSTTAQSGPYKGGSGTYTKLIWADEFSINGLPDTRRWQYEKGYIRNKELQYYTDRRIENTKIENGFLHINARNDSLREG